MAKYKGVDRFWDKVKKTDYCWIWTGSLNRLGYGQFRVGNKIMRAHRIAFQEINGPIPEGLTLDHLCRNPACVRPDHLEPVTMRENIRRGLSPFAKKARAAHCINGHLFDENNTRLRKTKYGTGRQCKECERQRRKKSVAVCI